MVNYIRYRNFKGEYQFYEDKQEFYGNILGIEPVIDFCGKTEEELEESFKEGIETYNEYIKFSRQTEGRDRWFRVIYHPYGKACLANSRIQSGLPIAEWSNGLRAIRPLFYAIEKTCKKGATPV